MKTIAISFSLFVTIIFQGVAQHQSDALYIRTIGFSHPILESWLAAYNQINPDAAIRIADKNGKSEYEVSVLIHEELSPENSSEVIIPVARYALLPVTNPENPLLKELGNKNLDKSKIRKLFFEQEFDEEEKYPFKNEAVVYSGTRADANAFVIADYFNKNKEQLRGKKIAGDDIFLTQAIKKDPNGVAFNYLNYLYDEQTRQLKDGLTLLPLDLKKEQWQAINSSLDETLELLEKQKINLIPVYTLSLSFDKKVAPGIQDFINWVLTSGQELNHQHGFLQVDGKTKSLLPQENKLITLR